MLLAVQTGALDALTPQAVEAFQAGLAAALDSEAADTLAEIARTRTLGTAGREALVGVVTRLAGALADGTPGADDPTGPGP